jgi:predicted phage-related endonuclease
MQTHDLKQGSKEWHEFRSTHYGASEAAAMLGLSKQKTRGQLLHEKYTGLTKDVSDFVQERIFDKGHDVEALARPIIEARIGESLSPVTCSDGKLSCSCDGITFGDDIAWEHKQYNGMLFNQVSQGILPEEHQPQCQQILMITGADKLIFTCSDGTSEREISMDVFPDQAWFERIRTGWAQFEHDLAAYTPPEVIEKPIPTAVMALPALQVQIKGEVTASNLPAFVDAADSFLSRIKTELVEDQDFADADANVKALDAAEKGIEQAKAAITAQAADIDTIMRTMDLYKTKLRDVRLKLTGLVKTEKEARKLAILTTAKGAFLNHVASLSAETKPIQLAIVIPDFAGAIKGKSKLSAMQDALDTAVANGKIEADAVAKDVRSKLAWFSAAADISESNPASLRFLFPDLQQIISKQMDDFVLLVNTRIDAHKKAEAEKIERIRLEEEARAQAKVEAEQLAKQVPDPFAKELGGNSVEATNASVSAPQQPQTPAPSTSTKQRPADVLIIRCIITEFGCTNDEACDLILGVAERLRAVA